MTETLVLFVPNSETPWQWLRIAGGAVRASGEGFPALAADSPETRVAIAPAEAVSLHWAELPDRSQAQAVAAARLLAAEASATPIAELHVAVGREGSAVERPIGVVAAAQLRAWLDLLAQHGVDPDAMLPAPMLLPRPENGYVSAVLGGDTVVRGTTSGFAAVAGLTELVTGGVAPVPVPRDARDAAIVAAVTTPTLDLRQGAFAKRTRRSVDWALVQRLGWLSAAILGVTVLLTLVQLMTYSAAADDLEQRTELVARTGLARGEAVSDADRQLTARLERLRGGGQGFSQTAAAVYAAIRATPGSEAHTLAFDANGTLHIAIGVQNEGEILDLQRRLRASGFVATPQGQFQSLDGRLSGDLTVKPQ